MEVCRMLAAVLYTTTLVINAVQTVKHFASYFSCFLINLCMYLSISIFISCFSKPKEAAKVAYSISEIEDSNKTLTLVWCLNELTCYLP